MRTLWRHSAVKLNVAQAGADGICFRRRYIFKEEFMKLLKRILAVTFVVVVAIVISYLLYTGGQTGA